MDSIKKPEVAISATTAVTLIATILYFRAKNKSLEEKLDAIQNNLMYLNNEFSNLKVQGNKLDDFSKNLSSIKTKQKRLEDNVSIISDNMAENGDILTEIIKSLNKISDETIQLPRKVREKKYKRREDYSEDENDENDSDLEEKITKVIKHNKSRKGR